MTPSIPTILVVEDDETIRRMLKSRLDDLGIKVVQADDGSTAIAALDEHTLDMACIDLSLPQVSGFEVCRQIRNHPANREIPILIISARNTLEDHAYALELGATKFLEKPFRAQEFIDVVKKLVRRHRKRRPAQSIES